MKEALKLISENKVYKVIFKEVYNKYKKYEKITGSFTIVAKSSEDKDVLINFDNNVLNNGIAKIKSSKVEELFKRKLDKASFIELLEEVVGEKVKTNKEIKDKEKEELEKFYEYILLNSKDGLGREWFKYSIDKKLSGYTLIMKKYKEYKNLNNIEILKKELILVNNALSNLPYNYNRKENIAVFSANETKDPHFFDGKRYTGELLIRGIRYILNRNEESTINELNELYYDAGLLKDEISNHTTIFSFNAYDNNNEEIPQVGMYTTWEPLQISISNLVKINYFKVKNDRVYVFENPAVFQKVLKELGDKISLICTSGQLNLSSYIILDKIKNLKRIYYAGDFDPEGLLIADKIKLRYREKVDFLLYKKEYYNRIKSSSVIKEQSISKLDNINSKELEEIKEVIKVDKKAGYQELLIDDYIMEIRNNLN